MTIGAVVLGAIDRPADRSLQLVYEERYLNTNTIQRVFGHVAWVAVVLFAFTVCVRLALGFKFGLLLLCCMGLNHVRTRGAKNQRRADDLHQTQTKIKDTRDHRRTGPTPTRAVI